MAGGSQKGERRGGRQKGTPNRATRIKKQAADRGIKLAEGYRITPLEMLLNVMNAVPGSDKVTDRQFNAAVAAIGYCHARLAAVAYVPPPDQGDQQRRSALAGLNYQQRKQIEQILLGATIEGDPLTEDDNQ